MYAQQDTTAPSSWSSISRPTPSRVILRTRPRLQRTLIRSWEYNRSIRINLLAIRMLVVVWLIVLSALLFSAHSALGWAMLPAAAAVAAISLWVFTTAAKGWPVDEA